MIASCFAESAHGAGAASDPGAWSSSDESFRPNSLNRSSSSGSAYTTWSPGGWSSGADPLPLLSLAPSLLVCPLQARYPARCLLAFLPLALSLPFTLVPPPPSLEYSGMAAFLALCVVSGLYFLDHRNCFAAIAECKGLLSRCATKEPFPTSSLLSTGPGPNRI